MKKGQVHILILLLSLVLATGACKMLSNDPGDISQPEGLDIAISNVDAPISAVIGQTVIFDFTLQNTGQNPLTDDITITIKDLEIDSVIGTQVITDGLPIDSSANTFYRWNTDSLTAGDYSLLISHDVDDINTQNNSFSVDLALNEQEPQDLAITSLESPATINQGDTAPIVVTITNLGILDINEEVSVSLRNETEASVIETRTLVNGLMSGNSISFDFIWSTRGLAPGDYTIEATHNFVDTTPQNNSGSAVISIVEADETDGADIAITTIDAPTSADQGTPVEITATFQNIGNTAFDGDIIFNLTDETSGENIGTQNYSGLLESDDTAEITFNWNTEEATSGDHELRISHNFEDGNLGNNSQAFTVNISESSILDIGFIGLSAPTSLSQGEEADINIILSNEGQINIDEEIDIFLVDETDGNTIAFRETDPGFEAGGTREFGIVWETEEASIGQHTLVATHEFEDANQNNDSRSVTVTITEPEFNISDFEPNEMESFDRKEITVRGTGFREGIDINFFVDNNGNGRGRDDDDDDDDDDDSPPQISDINVLDSKNIEITVWTWGSRQNVQWSARFTHPNGEVVEINNALRITD